MTLLQAAVLLGLALLLPIEKRRSPRGCVRVEVVDPEGSIRSRYGELQLLPSPDAPVPVSVPAGSSEPTLGESGGVLPAA